MQDENDLSEGRAGMGLNFGVTPGNVVPSMNPTGFLQMDATEMESMGDNPSSRSHLEGGMAGLPVHTSEGEGLTRGSVPDVRASIPESELNSSRMDDMHGESAGEDREADRYKEEGNAAFAIQEYHRAVAAYSMAIELAPTRSTLFSNRSAAYTKLGLLDKAIRDADMCIALDPDWAKGYWRKGTAQLENQAYKEAIVTFETGLEHCPTDRNLVEGKRKAIKCASVVDAIVGDQHGNFDIDAPSQRKKDNGAAGGDTVVEMGDEEMNDGSYWPHSAEIEILRIGKAKDYYEVLNCSKSAVEGNVKRNYHKLARILHPDKCQIEGAEQAMIEVTLAYNTLTTPHKKETYDMFINERDGEMTFAEWEAKKANDALPKWLRWLLQIRGCGLCISVLALIPVVIVLIPLLILLAIFYYPYVVVLRCCFPGKYQEHVIHLEKERARVDEEHQDEKFSHL
uniref:J domain-containing protein n=1 Tax=Compsopogon caeruleus TaxID=31354 RepID=A0A7S1TCA8_9RHOD|mmetsp:Transcript_17374/g.36070  ORF Transcript_17374/g.36070 Transcript_17374/m.36070 type:complete len:454 (+) Transcript_17374:265-1626(+)|eukprot:CAMPEP_0184677848 /NCGR_PEP_ID=MMETSP0312-20130426/467_1 /TAXON_ID=31354 /ORGANISM="Compsopogon coeruleus, Strain SAG 36.94" /LENGTH=453 /DNA_ID=CAMNT_0027126023 /DNA_START=261 /DNA_END=1622 /DNA_ORIENTATION=-